MEHVAVEGSKMNTFLMTFQELNDISVKNRVRLCTKAGAYCFLRLRYLVLSFFFVMDK